MRFFYTLFFTIMLSFAANGASVISGRVINATQDSAALPAAEVLLQKATSNSAPLPVAQTITSRQGIFRFSLDRVDVSATYYIASDFQGVRYFSDAVKLEQGKSIDVDLTVRDSTHSTKGVEAFMHHIMINDNGAILQFRETHVLNNPGDKTITQAFVDETVGPALFKFPLPPMAQNFQPISTHDLIKEGHYVYDRGVFLPGKKTLAFAYQMPMHKKQLPVTIHIPQTARTFDIFVGSDNIVVNSEQLQDYGKFNIRGTQYHRYGAANVDAGAAIKFTIRRAGPEMPPQSPTLALTLTAGLLLISVAYSLSQKSKIDKTGEQKKRRNASKKSHRRQ